ncbi:MAG: ParB/RepB/Spo0J family partition protein [Nannocystis sp.]|nr:ParB/RepB/Spo0J family partition protein [Nannocystis sp.]MBA3547160.1 ParB/RepB/Spo0J family partition protein [Nannocystis sp.]
MNLPKRPVLGRGLGALIPQRPAATSEAAPVGSGSEAAPGGLLLRMLPIESLVPNRDQPRKHFEAALLRELADSIRVHGILQPIVCTPHNDPPGSFMIVAGERRWRAAQLAGLHDVPVVIRDTPESDRLELAVLENLQRLDLSPIEEAQAYRQLMDVREYTQELLAERLGKDRSTVANALRLLKLPPRVQALVQEGRLSMGHARALLALESPADMIELALEAMQKGYTVRAVERAVRARLNPEPALAPSEEQSAREVIVRDLEDRLRRGLGVKVAVKTSGQKQGSGTIELPYGSLDELDRLLQMLLPTNDRGEPET